MLTSWVATFIKQKREQNCRFFFVSFLLLNFPFFFSFAFRIVVFQIPGVKLFRLSCLMGFFRFPGFSRFWVCIHAYFIQDAGITIVSRFMTFPLARLPTNRKKNHKFIRSFSKPRHLLILPKPARRCGLPFYMLDELLYNEAKLTDL